MPIAPMPPDGQPLPAGGDTEGPRPADAGVPPTGWALLPQPRDAAPRRQRARALGPTAWLGIAFLAGFAALFAWLAAGVFSGETSHAWEVVPQGQPYYEPPVPVGAPASATGSGPGSASATAKRLAPELDAVPSGAVTLTVNTPPLGGQYGGTGQVQDAFSPSYFAVRAGATVHVTVLSYDTAWHTFSAPALGLNVWIHPAVGNRAGRTTFTFVAGTSGYYEWFCDIPCDGYSMQSPGFMAGEIHAVKA